MHSYIKFLKIENKFPKLKSKSKSCLKSLEELDKTKMNKIRRKPDLKRLMRDPKHERLRKLEKAEFNRYNSEDGYKVPIIQSKVLIIF